MGMCGKPRNQFINLCLWGDSTGWVGGAVYDDQAGFIGDLRQNRFRIKRKAIFFQQSHWNRRGAAIANNRFIDGKARVWINNFSPCLTKHQNRKKHRGFSTGYDNHVIRVNRSPMTLL